MLNFAIILSFFIYRLGVGITELGDVVGQSKI